MDIKKMAGAVKGLRLGTDEFWFTDWCRTEQLIIDWALGGGWGYGRIAEIAGDWSTCKTVLLYYTLMANTRRGGVSVLIESEGAFNPDFFKQLGGDPSKVLVLSVRTCEEVFDAIIAVVGMAKSDPTANIVVGWDSIAATGTKHLAEVGMAKRDMSKPLVMSIGTSLVTSAIADYKIAVVSVNQLREKIGTMSTQPHTPGGNAWPYACSHRLFLRYDGGWKGSMIWGGPKGDQEVGRWIKGRVEKNKLASPFGEFSFPMYIMSTEKQADIVHPEFGGPLKMGIHFEEALFYFYLRGFYKMPTDASHVITGGGGGWHTLHPMIFPGVAKFRKKEWLDVLKEHPELRTLPHDLSK